MTRGLAFVLLAVSAVALAACYLVVPRKPRPVPPRKPGLRVVSSRLAAASRALGAEQRGTQEDLDARDIAEMEAWAPFRRRAGEWDRDGWPPAPGGAL